ncbi:MAG: type I DNA topoisomerase [Gammaproteobacteria bacterium]|nr:type I DNA topoisomerase [Gammaproteobacteria bacterium]
MENTLVIVESPAKAKTIKKYLGAGYHVLASYGHVRDLVPKSGAVDPNNDFAMRYEIIAKNAKHVDEIVKAMKKADHLLLATDPDREGEAIAWNIAVILTERKALKDKTVKRVVFHEITKTAILAAVANPREIAMDLVNAQQARRALDYLVGFNLSPLLWKKVRRGLSAGRVQSPALRLIVERELEIEKFKNKEYWTIESDLTAAKQHFSAKLAEYQTEKVEQFTVTNSEQAEKIKIDLEKQANGKLVVSKVDKKQRKRNPTAPFITSTLQQEAARKLGFTAQRTMRVAQQLYEGVEVGTGSTGLISYMRTDSVNVAAEAIAEIRDLIVKRYGKENLPDEIRVYTTKSKNAQEAHEAIRPTSAFRRPDEMKDYLSIEQFKLYDLIWKRTVASQMISATINTVAVDLICGKAGNRFRANGSTIADPGFMMVYQEALDDAVPTDGDEKLLPPMKEGDIIDLQIIRAEQHFTEPPPRYSEASLIKTLEEYGIGRPSTYASIISTLQNRDYARLETKRFFPTDVGRVVNHFLTNYFTQYVDYTFTANLEDELDEVSRGERQWIPLLREFWDPFIKQVHDIDATVQRSDVTQEKMDENCPECSKPLSIRLGRSGRFIGCTGFPECAYTRSLDGDKDAVNAAEVIGDRKCPKDEADLVIKQGPYGKFIGCSNYPKCKFIEPLEKPRDTQVPCPKCHKGSIVQRKSKRGKIFFSCSEYPTCNYALWNEPIAEACPKCQWPLLTLKITKKNGKEKMCPQEGCGFSESME